MSSGDQTQDGVLTRSALVPCAAVDAVLRMLSDNVGVRCIACSGICVESFAVRRPSEVALALEADVESDAHEQRNIHLPNKRQKFCYIRSMASCSFRTGLLIAPSICEDRVTYAPPATGFK